MYMGMWTLFLMSIPLVICFIKLVDLVGKKSGYNILQSTQEMSYYPLSTRRPTRSNFVFPLGFAFNVSFITWAIASGFLLQFWETLLLSANMKPEFVDVVDTKRDLIDLNYTLSRVLTFQIDIIMHHNSSLTSV